jgi:hypothetical protein
MKLRIIALGKAGSGSSRSAGNPLAGVRAGVPPAEFAGPAPFQQVSVKENQTKSD